VNILAEIPLEIPDLIDPQFPDDASLTLLPPLVTSRDDPDAPAKRRKWKEYHRRVLNYRTARWWACGEEIDGGTGLPFRVVNTDQDAIEVNRLIELERCRRDPAYFITVWCAIKETRGDPEEDDAGDDGVGPQKVNWAFIFSQIATTEAPEPPGWQPAILYPFQVGTLRWIEWRVRMRKTGLISKARDMGATWIATLWALHGWLFKPSFTAKFVSRNAAAVYSRSDDAMFSRVVAQFDHKPGSTAGNPMPLPRWFWPKGFSPADHCTEMLLTNPETGNEINGESTSKKTGRSGRGTVTIVDEMAFIDEARHIFGTLRQTAGARIGLSSESIEVSDDFAEMADMRRKKGDGSVIDLDYFLHPEHDAAWLAAMEEEYREDGNLDGFLREVLREAAAGLGTWAYPIAKDITVGHFPYVHGAPIWVAIDPGSDDECALLWFSRDPHSGRIRLIRGYINRGQPPEFYAHLIAGFTDIPNEDDELGIPMWRWKEPELDLLEWVNSLPVRPSFVYGDPAGGQNTQGKKSSWYDKMAICWSRHKPDNWVKAVTYKGAGFDVRPLQTRRTELMKLLARLDFDNAPGCSDTLFAIANSRFDPGEDRITEQKGLRHDKLSHQRSAAEYFAVWHNRVAVMTEDPKGWKPIVRKRRTGSRAA
jgi:hypothetical protein